MDRDFEISRFRLPVVELPSFPYSEMSRIRDFAIRRFRCSGASVFRDFAILISLYSDIYMWYLYRGSSGFEVSRFSILHGFWISGFRVLSSSTPGRCGFEIQIFRHFEIPDTGFVYFDISDVWAPRFRDPDDSKFRAPAFRDFGISIFRRSDSSIFRDTGLSGFRDSRPLCARFRKRDSLLSGHRREIKTFPEQTFCRSAVLFCVCKKGGSAFSHPIQTKEIPFRLRCVAN